MPNNNIDSSQEFAFFTRADGISGMTVTALADFCGVTQVAITRLLNRLRDLKPITKAQQKALEPFHGKEWRLITNDGQNSLYVNDELCQAILEYYAFEARNYKGKNVAVENFRMISKAGMRIYIWSLTAHEPKLDTDSRITKLEEKFAEWEEKQRANPADPNYIPPGWSPDVWNALPPQDKRHFRFLHRKHGFHPEDDQLALPDITPETVRKENQEEIKEYLVEVSPEELEMLEENRRKMIEQMDKLLNS